MPSNVAVKSLGCLCRCLSGIRCTHRVSPVLESRSVLFEFAQSRRLFAFFLMVSHISAYSICCLPWQFPTMLRRFFIRARVGDDILIDVVH